MKSERLDKVLSNNGFGTRKTVRPLITRGRVSVNGQVVCVPDSKVDAEGDTICVDGEPVCIRTTICVMMNKPAGYVCSAKGGRYPTVFELLPDWVPRSLADGDLGIVGRLDADTEGLLLLTTSGEMNHRLTSPKYRVAKTYFVRLSEPVDGAERSRYEASLAAGLHIQAQDNDGEHDCLPASIEWCDEPGSARITVYEGKYHEIKRMFGALGNHVDYLRRIRIGGVPLDESLAPGQVRELTSAELDALFA